MSNQTKEQKLVAILPLLINNDVAKRHFYERIDETWLADLDSKYVFKLDSTLSAVSEDGYYPDWIEGRYLSRISKSNSQEVYEIIKKLETKDHTNPLLFELIIEILSNIADTVDITDVLNKAIDENWIGNKGRITFISFKLKDLVSNLVKSSNFRLINNLLKKVLEFKLPEGYLDISKRRFAEPSPLVEMYSLEEILKEISRIEFESEDELIQILKIVAESFNNYLELSNDLKDYENNDEYEDYSFIWKSAIDYDKDRLNDIKEDFVVAIRTLTVKNKAIATLKIIDVLDSFKKRIFQRMKIFILSEINIEENIIVKTIVDNITDRHNIHEVRLLLISKFESFSNLSKKKVLDKIQGSFMDEDVNHQARHKAYLIKPISQHLTIDQRNEFKSIIESKWEYVPSYKFSGVKSGPNSRYTRDDLITKSHYELVELFIEDEAWFNLNVHNNEMYSPRGLGRLWQTIVTENHVDYIDNLTVYDPSRILPLYVNHLLNGIEAVTNNGAKVNWYKIIAYIELILGLYEKDAIHQPSAKDPFDVGENGEIIISILRLIENGFKGKNLFPVYFKSKIWKILLKIFNLSNDTDEAFVEKNDKDYFTHSINSTGGLLLHDIYYYGFWLINKKKLKDYPTEVVQFISDFIDNHLEYKTGVSVMGKYLPWTQKFNLELFSKQVKYLLPKDDMKTRYIAWETYLANTIFVESYRALREVYEQSIKELDAVIPDRRYWADPKNTLLEHIMVGYIHELDDSSLEKTLFDLLLISNSTKHISYAVDFVGRAYASSENQKKKNLPEKELTRIKLIWQMILSKDFDPEVYENFGWWIRKDYYKDNKWLLEMLVKTLEKSNGYIDPDFKVLEQLNILAKEHPILVGKSLEMMVKSSKKEKTYYFRDKEVSSIIEQLEDSKNIEALTFAKETRETLVGYGYTQYTK